MYDASSALDCVLQRADAGLDGVVADVTHGSEHVRWSRGRWADGSIPSGDSIFYAASLTKQLMGILTAVGSDARELHTAESVRRWLPELREWADTVTISDLLHHTAGLPTELPSPPTRSANSVIEAVARLTEPDVAPGTRFRYSNDGYVLLAAILERAAGIPIDRLAAERVFGPLGMTRSVLTTRAHVSIASEPDPPATIGDGGWWTTTADVGRLLRHMNRDATKKRLVETGRLVNGESVDYAWGVRLIRIGGLVAASHGGSWARWQSKTLRIPERNCTVVVAARTDNAQAVSNLAIELATTLARVR